MQQADIVWTAIVLRDMAPMPYVKDFIRLLAKQAPVKADTTKRLASLR